MAPDYYDPYTGWRFRVLGPGRYPDHVHVELGSPPGGTGYVLRPLLDSCVEVPMDVRQLRAFDAQAAAEQWARTFDAARARNLLPPLTVESDDEGLWWVCDPRPALVPAPAAPPGRVPRTPVQAPPR